MSTRVQLICLAFLALAMAAIQWQFRRSSPPPTAGAAKYYLYCPECGLEMTWPEEHIENPPFCPHCGAGKQMQLSTFSRNDGQAPAVAPNRYFVAAAFGLPIALAVGVYWLGRERKRRRPAEPDEVLEFKCPGCGHAMASAAYRRGSTAVCPVCSELFVVTASDESVSAEGRWDESREMEAHLRSSLRKKPRTKRRRPRP
jgi:rubrerythrin